MSVWRYVVCVRMCKGYVCVCYVCICLVYFPRDLKKNPVIAELYSIERIAEIFDISKPREPSGTAKPAKLSLERAVGAKRGTSVPWLSIQDWPKLSTFTRRLALGSRAVEDTGSVQSLCGWLL